MRLPPPPPPPSLAKHTQLSYAGLRHSRGGCRARPGQLSVTDPARHPHSGRLTGRECRAELGRSVQELRWVPSQPWGCRAGPGRPSVTGPARHSRPVNRYQVDKVQQNQLTKTQYHKQTHTYIPAIKPPLVFKFALVNNASKPSQIDENDLQKHHKNTHVFFCDAVLFSSER